jgi:hypothetical protein
MDGIHLLALSLMYSVLAWPTEKKAYQRGITLIPKQALWLVQPSFANVNLMKAIFANAWAVAVVMGR